jgi:hypothetical protein
MSANDDQLTDGEEQALDSTSPSYNSGGLPNPLAWVTNNIETLKTLVNTLGDIAGQIRYFIKSPLAFLRRRIVPILVGTLLGFTNILANAFAAPFEAIQTGLQTLGDALVAPFSGQLIPITFDLGDDLAGFTTADSTFLATGAIAQAVALIVNLLTTTVETATAPFGPLQPFAVAAILLLAGYVGLLITLRAGRAVLDAIPGLSGIETFLFG